MTKPQMYKILLSFFFCTYVFTVAYPQRYEIAFMGGESKYIGDIGKEDYFISSDIGGGIIFKNTINPWMYMRVGAEYLRLHAYDKESVNSGRRQRDYGFEGGVIDVSLGIEYNFFPRNVFIKSVKGFHRFTPYMFTGVALISYFGNSGVKNSFGSSFTGLSVAIPMNIGLKYKLSEHFLFTAEAGAKYTLTDNLDGTSSYYRKANSNLGVPTTNFNSNDWYTFTSVGIIYTFGDLRCYFGF